MGTIDALLEKYWSDNITSAELDLLMELLEEKELDQNDYREEIAAVEKENRKELGSESAERLLRQIHSKINVLDGSAVKGSPVVRLLRSRIKWVAAAAIIIGIGLSYLYVREKEAGGHSSLAAETGTRVPAHYIDNTTNSVRELRLKDGSIIQLYPKSNITFSDSFNILERAIVLHGKALFKVAKDARRPFSVQANNIVTTALGTSFIIDENVKEQLQIKLLEGKVVIHSIEQDNKMTPVYLMPGQLCTIDLYMMKAVVEGPDSAKTLKQEIAKHKPHHPIGKKTFPLEFKKTPLARVFRIIEEAYSIKINYDPVGEKKNASFTGTITSSTSPEMLLTIICRTNDLTFEKIGESYFISKPK